MGASGGSLSGGAIKGPLNGAKQSGISLVGANVSYYSRDLPPDRPSSLGQAELQTRGPPVRYLLTARLPSILLGSNCPMCR